MRFGFRDVDPSGVVALDHHPIRVAGAEPAEVLPVEGIASALVLDFPQSEHVRRRAPATHERSFDESVGAAVLAALICLARAQTLWGGG
jgi:hypothetical protein